MSSSDESAEGLEPEVRYYLSGTSSAPVVYVEGPGWWRSYRPGRVTINQGSGPIPFGFKGALQNLEPLAALELLDATPPRAATPLREGPGQHTATEPEGLGGWLVLALIGLGLGLAGSIMNLALLAHRLPTEGGAGLSTYGRQTAVYGICLSSFYVIVIAVLLAMAFSKKRAFPRAMIAYQGFAFGASVASAIWAMVAEPRATTVASAIDPLIFELVRRVMVVVLSGAITGLWIAYYLKSKRVKNTFMRPLRQHH